MGDWHNAGLLKSQTGADKIPGLAWEPSPSKVQAWNSVHWEVVVCRGKAGIYGWTRAACHKSAGCCLQWPVPDNSRVSQSVFPGALNQGTCGEEFFFLSWPWQEIGFCPEACGLITLILVCINTVLNVEAVIIVLCSGVFSGGILLTMDLNSRDLFLFICKGSLLSRNVFYFYLLVWSLVIHFHMTLFLLGGVGV